MVNFFNSLADRRSHSLPLHHTEPLAFKHPDKPALDYTKLPRLVDEKLEARFMETLF